jgi:hypothetical protein
MDFNVLPFLMIAFCVLMMVLMMRGMHHGRTGFSRLAMGCCGFGLEPSNEHPGRLPTQAWWRHEPTCGNQSFDEYRVDTLRRLEEEQRDFQDFLARLKMAKDKAEFDQFMTKRRGEQKSSA